MKRLLVILAVFMTQQSFANFPMQGAEERNHLSLDGRWNALVDIMDMGVKGGWGTPKRQENSPRLKEVCFSGDMTLQVPGDWNSQHAKLEYFEDRMWYERKFYYTAKEGERQFLYFGAANSHAMVYLNNKLIGEHVGGFTPFQFEVTDLLNNGENQLIVRVSNIRTDDIMPGMDFDWWNYGGLTRSVRLISTPATYIDDYWVRLERGSMEHVLFDLKLDGATKGEQKGTLTLTNPNKSSAKPIIKKFKTNADGTATIAFDADLDLWSPSSPTLYDVTIATESDKVVDQIGFRCFETRGTEIFLNGEAVFLKGINMHEEIGSDMRRSFGEQDAEYLVDNLLELGCNFVRLTHYPADVALVRKCEERGLMIWEEIPVRGPHIDFTNQKACDGATYMMQELITRDKNRCGVVMWSVANETTPHQENREDFIKSLIKLTHEMDNTRAVTFATNASKYINGDNTTLVLRDPIANEVDIVGVNKYQGWYMPWGCAPADTQWDLPKDRPIVMSEFGAGALFGHHGDANDPNTFCEEQQVTCYENYLASQKNIPNLRGTVPWLLFDFKSHRRSHSMYQQGWNRKGLLSPNGDKKQAWYIINEYYKTK